MKKHVGVGAMKVYATTLFRQKKKGSGKHLHSNSVYYINVIYSRIIGFQASKSTLKRHMQVETLHTDEDQIINTASSDGSAMILVTP